MCVSLSLSLYLCGVCVCGVCVFLSSVRRESVCVVCLCVYSHGSVVEHCVSSAKVVGSIPRNTHTDKNV